ncbi:MAG: GH116 family glycosyl-hydrolase [Cellulomonas sp.]
MIGTPAPSPESLAGTRPGRWLGAGASAAAFPLGGIGTGNVSLGVRGELRDWELHNSPAKGGRLPFSFFAIDVRGAEIDTVTRVLQSRLRAPHEADQGYYAGDLGGLPRFDDSRMLGEYPFVRVDFDDAAVPVQVSLEAFTPFIPLDADASGIPCAVLRYRVTNPTRHSVTVSVIGSLANPVGAGEADVFHFPRFDGHPANEYRDVDGVRGLNFISDLLADSLAFGSATLTTSDESTTTKPEWLWGFWQDGAQVFWDDVRDDGRLVPEPVATLETGELPDWITRLRVGSLGIHHELAPGETRDFEFRLTWFFPNRPNAWVGNIVNINPHADEIVRNHYAARFADAWDVATHLDRHLPELEGATRAFHAALYRSSLPPEVIDAAGSNLAVIRSTTCFRLEDGTFAAWEGSFDAHGSCEGTCTHVWNYAQGLAFLFPELERSARRTEFLLETREDGRMNFRTNRIFDSPQWDFHPAVDGQLGTVVRLYREWRFSGDDELLREVWPAATRVLDFAFAEWDSNGDDVLDSKQHNTYDIEFYGENSLSNSVFFAALHAGAKLAEHLGEHETVARWLDAAERGSTRMDELLFNGEYYEQKLVDIDSVRYQYGTGVLSDQLFGQYLAHVTGLGHVLPAEHVKSAIESVFRYNFRTDLSEHHSVQRTYALGHEAGLLLCSWPHGGRPRIPFVYSDEVWTGIEYQVAAHLIFEGLVDEGLTLVRAVRARYDGTNRNPWNEVECGNHYARSLASWAVLIAMTGAQYDATARSLAFASAQGGALETFFSTGSGWGRASIDDTGVTLTLDFGTLALDDLTVGGRPLTLTSGSLAVGDSTRYTYEGASE